MRTFVLLSVFVSLLSLRAVGETKTIRINTTHTDLNWIVSTNELDGHYSIENSKLKEIYYREARFRVTRFDFRGDPIGPQNGCQVLSSNLVATLHWKGKKHEVTLESIPFFSTNRTFVYEKVKKYQ